jgi:tetratricopeptide (TPR) repeat protein
LAGILACTVILFFAPALTSAETNAVNNPVRSREDKSSVVNLAIQVVQQLQAQQQTNLHAIAEVKQQAEASSKRTTESVGSLRRLTLLTGALLATGMLALFLYERRLFRSLQQRMLMATALPAPNMPRRMSPEIGALVPQLLAGGRALLDQKQATAALACFDEAIALEINNAEAHVKKGFALEQLGRLEDALASFDHALALNALLVDAYVGKGDVLNRLERYQEALDCFDRAARLQPKPVAPNAHAPAELISGSH